MLSLDEAAEEEEEEEEDDEEEEEEDDVPETVCGDKIFDCLLISAVAKYV